jgi:Holliday junction DNA helicase RuvA
MIAKLSGRVDATAEGSAVLDVSGVGYLLFCSGRTLGRLQPGAPATLFVETRVGQDHIHLYGFADAAERQWFRLLDTVQGVGAKVALAILTVLEPAALAQAIAAQDRVAITRAPGVGPKLAQRILAELKDKAGAIALGAAGLVALSASEITPQVRGPLADAVSALVNLGYGRSEAYGAVNQVASRLGAEAALAELIKGGLKELSA